jgi:hypothetical protein
LPQSGQFITKDFTLSGANMSLKKWAANSCAILIRTAAFSSAICLIPSLARGQAVVDSHGFEQPFFSTTFGPGGTGQFEGQTPSTPNGTWQKSSVGLGTATVQTAIVNGGNQAVRVNRGALSDDRWGVPVTGSPSERSYASTGICAWNGPRAS